MNQPLLNLIREKFKRRGLLAVTVICFAQFLSSAAWAQANFTVDFATSTGNLTPFWNASGVFDDPIDKLNSSSYYQDMQHIGSVPHLGVAYQRPHNLLSFIDTQGAMTANPVYNWSRLDQFMDVTVKSSQKFFFELMGQPGYPTNFTIDANVRAWKNLVRDLALHLEARYGQAEVRTWYFETWNEPDASFAKSWAGTTELNNYYDACVEGLKAADPMLKMGGPAAASPRDGSFVWGLAEHCARGTNYFTGQVGVKLDFISYHIKDTPAGQVSSELTIINRVKTDYPELTNVMFVNDEGDADWTWHRDVERRSNAWYAGYIARQTNEHLVRIVNGLNVPYRLANDNAFIGTEWGNRAQLMRFSSNGNFALLKKPMHNVMTQLALLGNKQSKVTGFTLADQVGILATSRGTDQVAVLVYNYLDDETIKSSTKTVQLNLTNLPFTSGKLAHYRIDQTLGNINQIWKDMGSPVTPTDAQIQQIRNAHELNLLNAVTTVSSTSTSLNFSLPVQGVSLILISKDPGVAPVKVTGLYATRYISLSGTKDDIMLKWDNNSRVIKTFEVLYSATSTGTFTRVNTPDLIATGFVHQKALGAGFYKVRAVDYWGRTGAESDVVSVPVPPNMRPTVSLTSPTNTAAYSAPATVQLTATASDIDGTISKVEFYNGSTLIFSDASSPYSYAWTNVPANSYTITAKAYDNSGATTTSAASNILVTSGGTIYTVDNTDPGFSTTGTWTVSTSSSQRYGINYLHDGDTQANNVDVAKWTSPITATARYDVYMIWAAQSDRPAAARVVVNYNGGVDSLTVNQRINGGIWNKIGTWSFTGGSGDYVLLRANDLGNTIADAVRWVPEGGAVVGLSVDQTTDGLSLADLNEESATGNSLLVYPNPTSGSVNLSFTAELNGQASVEFYNAIGQKVLSASRTVSAGTNNLKVDLSAIPATGVYYVKVVSGGKTMNQTVLINK